MKKAILSIAVLTLLFSCKKEDEKTPIVTIAKFAELSSIPVPEIRATIPKLPGVGVALET